MKKIVLSIIFLALMAGCGVGGKDYHFVAQKTNLKGNISIYMEQYWLNKPARLQLHHMALLKFKNYQICMDGILRLDAETKQATLVAINPFGIKLFDLSIVGNVVKYNFILPALNKNRLFPEQVADCIKKIFLNYQPAENDDIISLADKLKIMQRLDNGYLESIFDIHTKYLLEKSYFSAQKIWQISFADYKIFEEMAVPTKIVFQDYINNYTLVLKLVGLKVL